MIKNNSKSQVGIWIDGTKAIVISLQNGEQKVHEIESKIQNKVHHPELETEKNEYFGAQYANGAFTGARRGDIQKKHDSRKENEEHRFLDHVIEEVKHADEVYITGPGQMKLKLRSRMSPEVAKKLQGVEASPKMTLNQMVARVKEFFNEPIRRA